jgi:hypothetical protein
VETWTNWPKKDLLSKFGRIDKRAGQPQAVLLFFYFNAKEFELPYLH